MSKLANKLRALNVYNNWNMLQRFGTTGDAAIEYKPPTVLRGMYTSVWSPYKHPQLNPPEAQRGLTNTHYQEFSGKRAASFPVALKWAEKMLGHEYVISPFGGRLPKHVVDKARATVREAFPPTTSARYDGTI